MYFDGCWFLSTKPRGNPSMSEYDKLVFVSLLNVFSLSNGPLQQAIPKPTTWRTAQGNETLAYSVDVFTKTTMLVPDCPKDFVNKRHTHTHAQRTLWWCSDFCLFVVCSPLVCFDVYYLFVSLFLFCFVNFCFAKVICCSCVAVAKAIMQINTEIPK